MPNEVPLPANTVEDFAPGGVAAVDRALSLLGAFRYGDTSLSLQELSERTGLYKSTILRLLASLEHARFITRGSDGRYSIGVEVARLQPFYIAGFSLADAVNPVLKKLVHDTKESAAFHICQSGHRICLYRVDSPQSIRYHISEGDVLPMDKGAGGRLLSAYMGAKGPLYEQIRHDGFVVLKGDRLPELSGVSAVVRNGRKELVGAVTLTMPTSRWQDGFLALVQAAAQDISRQLGA